MARRIAAAVARALPESPTEEKVHFHAGANGRPDVCDNPRCTSPSLHVDPA
jgi:hypothetical protein